MTIQDASKQLGCSARPENAPDRSERADRENQGGIE